MRIVAQRVKHASVEVDGIIVSKIKSGLLVFLGISKNDTEKEAEYLADKIVGLRTFEDDNGKMNLSVTDLQKQILVVSQFTLYGDCSKGRRPSFTNAMEPIQADMLYKYFILLLKQRGIDVENGIFGAKMSVSLLNDGPVTFIIDSI